MLLIPICLAYKAQYNTTPVHQHLAKEALDIWPLIPYEIRDHATNSINKPLKYSFLLPIGYSFGDDIITGSAEEDIPPWESTMHFWESDSPQNGNYNDGIDIIPLSLCDLTGNCKSSYKKAKENWETKVIPYYLSGKIDASYYWFGRVAHLLEDATVPAHTHQKSLLLNMEGDINDF